MIGMMRTVRVVFAPGPWFLGIACLAILSGGESPAAPIRRDAIRVDAVDSKSWSRFMLGGPSVWSRVAHPQVTPQVEAAIWRAIRTDPGGTAPILDYLLWKQRRDPERFAFYHPKLAPALTRLVAPAISPQQIIPPSAPSAIPSIQPQQIPEPGAFLIAALMIGFAARGMLHAKVWRTDGNRAPRS